MLPIDILPPQDRAKLRSASEEPFGGPPTALPICWTGHSVGLIRVKDSSGPKVIVTWDGDDGVEWVGINGRQTLGQEVSQHLSASASHSRRMMDAGLLLAILGLATTLRVYDLQSQLWLDEMAALEHSRRPLLSILTEWPPQAHHALYAILAHISIGWLGESAAAVRLPAALFGLAGVGALGLLAVRLFGRKIAFVATGMFAVSYHHVFFSQDARGYTALIFFFLIASYLLIRFQEEATIKLGPGVLYGASLVFGAYSHPFGLFILPAHVLTIFGAYVLTRARTHERALPPWPHLVYVFLAGLVTIILYAPFAPSIVGMAAKNAATAADGPRLGFWLFQEILEGLSAAFLGPIGVLAVAAVGIIGVVVWVRRHPFSLAVVVVPIVLQAVTFIGLGFGIHPRYFAIALPTVYLIGGCALGVIVGGGLRRLRTTPAWRGGAEAAVLGTVILVSAYPLVRYYTVPKQDFRGALDFLKEVSGPGDLKIGLQSTGYVLGGSYRADVTRVDTLGELLAAEAEGRPVWVVSSLERVGRASAPDLYEYVQTNYEVVERFPGTIGDGTVKVYAQRTSPQLSSQPSGD